MTSPTPQHARVIGRPQTQRWVDREATLLIIAPPFHGTPAVMDTGSYMRAWMILDNYPHAQVYALDGANLRQCRMSEPQPNRRSKDYPAGGWWTRDIEYVPFSRGPLT
jgi:hypothetical protein